MYEWECCVLSMANENVVFPKVEDARIKKRVELCWSFKKNYDYIG